jgi:hypothetical protein
MNPEPVKFSLTNPPRFDKIAFIQAKVMRKRSTHCALTERTVQRLRDGPQEAGTEGSF